jgi:hypothetical protein
MARKNEKRTGIDRRQIDFVPPEKWERRMNVEARKPEIVEVKLSITEWEKFFGSEPATTRKLEKQATIGASGIFGHAKKRDH